MIPPHVLFPVVFAIGGVWVGWIWGSTTTAADYEAQKADARVDSAVRYAAELTRATDASIANQGVSIELTTTMHVHRTRSDQLIREVHADVDAHPDLDACLVPDATRRLRDEQVADSARAAADHPAVRR